MASSNFSSIIMKMEMNNNKSVPATNEKVTNYIPDDIAFSVLSKLPIKSLKRFQCVRKSWCLLFEDSQFMSMFRNNFLSKPQSYDGDTSLLVNDYHGKLRCLSGERFENRVNLNWPNLSPNVKHDYFRIFGFASVNGMFCLHDRRYGRVILWNPTTEEFKVIPHVKSFFEPIFHNVENEIKLAPYYFRIHGFGYDRVADDYKVICHVSLNSLYLDLLNDHVPDKDSWLLQDKSRHSFWEIYSLRSNRWRKLDVNMPHSFTDLETDTFGNFHVYKDGVWHWFCMHKKQDESFGRCLVSFHLNNETFFITLVPSYVRVVLAWTQLTVLNDSIALISLPQRTQTFSVSILGEVGVNESWIKLFVIEQPYNGIPIGVGINGEILFKNNIRDNKLVWFDLNTKKIVEPDLIRTENKYHSNIKIYKKSLLPIGGINLLLCEYFDTHLI